MAYTIDDIYKILEFKSWPDEKKLSELLRIDAALYCSLGTDSTKADRDSVKSKSRTIYKAIKTFDKSTGEMFLRAMDMK